MKPPTPRTMAVGVAVGQVWEYRNHGVRRVRITAIEPTTVTTDGRANTENIITGHKGSTLLHHFTPHYHWHFVASGSEKP
jgi:hypothetical protein